MSMTDARLRDAYATCRRVNARHGRSFYLATLLLPAVKRPHVHALYAFARLADDIVDRPGVDAPAARREIADMQARFTTGDRSSPVLLAVHDTVERWRIPLDPFDAFFASMRMDLDHDGYATWAELQDYMRGSAAAIALQTLPILEPAPGLSEIAADYACDLGRAFQLTNFIRDIGEDLGRGRLYLPAEDLAEFGVSRDELEAGHVGARVRRLIAFEIARARELYRVAAHGVRLLHPTSRDCIATALVLYSGILDAVERADYQVLDRRVSVGVARRAAVVAPALRRAHAARRPHHTHHDRVWRTSEKPNSRSSTGA
jgi:15-cis-phytoene synthase